MTIAFAYNIGEQSVENVTVTLDETANLAVFNCTSSRSPPTIVSWFKDDVKINNSITVMNEQQLRNRSSSVYDNMLKISYQNLSSGKYTCKVNNTLGGGMSETDVGKSHAIFFCV